MFTRLAVLFGLELAEADAIVASEGQSNSKQEATDAQVSDAHARASERFFETFVSDLDPEVAREAQVEFEYRATIECADMQVDLVVSSRIEDHFNPRGAWDAGSDGPLFSLHIFENGSIETELHGRAEDAAAGRTTSDDFDFG